MATVDGCAYERDYIERLGPSVALAARWVRLGSVPLGGIAWLGRFDGLSLLRHSSFLSSSKRFLLCLTLLVKDLLHHVIFIHFSHII